MLMFLKNMMMMLLLLVVVVVVVCGDGLGMMPKPILCRSQLQCSSKPVP